MKFLFSLTGEPRISKGKLSGILNIFIRMVNKFCPYACLISFERFATSFVSYWSNDRKFVARLVQNTSIATSGQIEWNR